MWQIYHNSRCSKSRAALTLLEEKGITPEIINYLETPLTAELLSTLLIKLNKHVDEVVRPSEDAFKTVKKQWRNYTENEKIQYVMAHPILLERPIIVHNDHARIGRPTEIILELFEN